MTPLRRFLFDTVRDLRDDARRLRTDAERARLSLATVAAVLLAYAAGDWLALHDRWWAALSAFVVVRAGWASTLQRCAERLAGTLAGAGLGIALGMLLATLPRQAFWLWPCVLAISAGGGLFVALRSARSYFWILAAVTTVMVLGDARLHHDLLAVAQARVADVAVGIGAAMIALACVGPWWTRAGELAVASTPPVAPGRAGTWLALHATLAVGALAAFYDRHPFPDLAQALVSVVAVLLVPLTDADADAAGERINTKMRQRILGCLGAALLAAVLLPLVGGSLLASLLTLAAGVWLAAHWQAGTESTRYVGTQFGVGFIMVFVQDAGSAMDVSATAHRLLGICIGLGTLGLLMLVLGRFQRPHPTR